MTDLSRTIAPKSDQLNADDLIAGPMTITITKVSLCAGEQPIAINFDGDNGKPYKPCKSMRRVLVSIWGSDGGKYIGRSMTLYNDADVAFGGAKVGGIRISHMSDMEEERTMALTATRARRKPYTVKPLVIETKPPIVESKIDTGDLWRDSEEAAAKGTDALKAYWDSLTKDQKLQLQKRMPGLKSIAAKADAPASTEIAEYITPWEQACIMARELGNTAGLTDKQVDDIIQDHLGTRDNTQVEPKAFFGDVHEIIKAGGGK